MTEDEIMQDSKVIAQIVEDMNLFDYSSHIVYVNGSCKGEYAIGKRMLYETTAG